MKTKNVLIHHVEERNDPKFTEDHANMDTTAHTLKEANVNSNMRRVTLS